MPNSKEPKEPKKPKKRQVNVRLTPLAYQGLADFCRAEGISLTGYLEALGLWFVDNQNIERNDRAQRELERVTEHARRLDADGRFKRPRA
jgi:hypothetical protein